MNTIRRLRADRLPGGIHCGRRRADQAHPAGHRGGAAAVSPPAHGGRPMGAARSPHPGPGHVRHGPGGAAIGRLHDGHRSDRPAPDDAGIPGSDPGSAARRTGLTHRPPLRLVHPARRAVAHPPVHLALSRDLDGSHDLAVGSTAGRQPGYVAAVAVDVGARRLCGAREHLAGGVRAGRQGRPGGAQPPRLARAVHHAPVGYPRPGDPRLHLRAAGFLEVLRRGRVRSAVQRDGRRRRHSRVRGRLCGQGKLPHRNPRGRDRIHRRFAQSLGRLRDSAATRA